MENNKVSVIIPVYNEENYLREAIVSALNQTYNNLEIIAVNDGSTDKSLEILKEYHDRIKIISKENGGTSSALNAGYKEMTGEWLKWHSADDVLYPTAVEELILDANKLTNKEETILYSNFDQIDSNGKIIKEIILPNYNEFKQFDQNVVLLDHNFINFGTTLIHKSALDKFGLFDESLNYQDYEFLLRFCIVNNFELHLVSKVLAKNRIHSDQESNKIDEKRRTEQLIGIKKSIFSLINDKKRNEYENALNEYQKQSQVPKKKGLLTRLRLKPSS